MIPKQLLNNSKPSFKKSKKPFFLALKMVKIGQNHHVTEAEISPKNVDFVGHQNFFGVDSTRKYGPFKSKNNAQTILKQLPNNFENGQNLTQKYAPPTRHPPTK